MSSYTEKEKEEFRKKDERISRQGLTQSLIESGLFTREEVENGQKLFEVVELYRNYVVNGLETSVAVSNKEDNWESIASANGLLIPNANNIKLLQLIADIIETKEQSKPSKFKLMSTILNRWKGYPTRQNSVDKVIENLNIKTVLED